MVGNDGTLNFDTKIDSSGFQKGLDGIGGAAQKGLSVTSKVLGGAATAITALGGAAIKVGSDFEAGMSQVQAVSGASGEALEQLKEKAKEMGAKTKFSATESAEAMNYMAMAGWKTEEMLNGIEGIMNLAAASGEDLATTSDIVTDALTAFGMTAADSTHFADILAAASSNANTNVGMMGETFKYVAPLAGSLGYSAEDTATAIGLMANAGIKGSQAGTSLRSTLTRLAKPTKESSDAMYLLGVSMTDDEGKMYSLMEVMEQIRNGFAGGRITQEEYTDSVARWKQMLAEGSVDMNQYSLAMESLDIALNGTTEAQRAEIAAMLGGQEAMSGLLAIVNASDADFEKLSGAINNASYNIDEISEALQKSGVQWEKYSDKAWTASGGMSGLLDEVIYNLAEAGTSAEELQEYLQFEYDMDADDAIKTIETVKKSLEDSKGAAEQMAETMQDNLQGQITILQSGLEGLGVSLYETMQGTAKDVVKEAQGMVQQLQDAFNDGGFEGLVSSVGNVLAQIVQRIADAAPMVVEAAVSLVSSFCDGLKSAPGIGESGAKLITSLVTGLMSCVGEIWSTAIVLIGKLAEGIATGAPQMIQAASTALTDIIECIVDWMPDILQAGIDIIVALAEGIAGALPTLITQAAVIVSDIALALVENIPALIDAALKLVTGLVQGLVDGIPVLLEGAIQLFLAILEALPVVIEQLLQALPDLITTIIDFFTQNIPLIVDGAIQLLMGIIEAIPTIIQAIVNNLPQIITALVNGLTGALPQLLEAAITLLMAIIEAIPDIVVAIAENLPQIITAIATGLAQAIPQIFTAAKDLLWQIIKAIPEIVVAIGGAIPDIIAGIVNGLIGGIGAVWDAACELGSGILDGIKSFFGINSPSTVMTEQGDYLVQGLIIGIANMPAELAAYLDQTVQKIIAWGQQMFSNVQTIIQNVVNTAEQLISQLPGKIWTHLVTVVTKVTAWGQQMLTTATTAISNMISSIISLMSELPGKVATHLSNVVSNVISWGSELASKGAAAAKGLFDAVVNGVSDLPAKMTEIGSNIVSGIWNGISSGWNWLKDKVADLANSLLEGAKDALEINSPSKRFDNEFGRWLMPGAMKGVKKSMPQTLKDMKAEAGKLVAAMQGTVDLSMNKFTLSAAGTAGLKAVTSAGTIVEIDNSQSQENNYHVAVPTPSEVSKNQREAFRNFQKGVK